MLLPESLHWLLLHRSK